MFTGIIEALGTVSRVVQEGDNQHFTICSTLSDGLKIDQSVAHDGVCLTVTATEKNTHTVTAIAETLRRTRLGSLQVGDIVNLERAVSGHARLDGHVVQGHVDGTGLCTECVEAGGSWEYRFRFPEGSGHLLVDKGSVCVNGVSLTVVQPDEHSFGVAIIPYTFEHTTFKYLKAGDSVNLEFDILGKYIARYAELYLKKEK